MWLSVFQDLTESGQIKERQAKVAAATMTNARSLRRLLMVEICFVLGISLMSLIDPDSLCAHVHRECTVSPLIDSPIDALEETLRIIPFKPLAIQTAKQSSPLPVQLFVVRKRRCRIHAHARRFGGVIRETRATH